MRVIVEFPFPDCVRQPGIFLARTPMSTGYQTVLDGAAIARCVKRLAHEIVEHDPQGNDLVLVGIVRRGASLALRLKAALAEITGSRSSDSERWTSRFTATTTRPAPATRACSRARCLFRSTASAWCWSTT